MQLVAEPRQQYQHQHGRVHDIENRSCDSDYHVETEVRDYSRRHADDDDEHAVANLIVCKLCKEACRRGHQRNGGGDTGKCNDDGEDDKSRLAQQQLNDADDEICTADIGREHGACGRTEVGKAEVDYHEQHARQCGGDADHFCCRLAVGVALFVCAAEDDDTEGHGGEDIHRLIAGLDAVDGYLRCAHAGIDDIADGRNEALDDEDEKSDEQCGGEYLADNVDDCRLLDAQKQDDGKEDDREHHGRHAAEERRYAHFQCGRCGSGDGDHGADAQDNRTHEDIRCRMADAAGDVICPACVQDGEHRNERKTDIGDKVE